MKNTFNVIKGLSEDEWAVGAVGFVVGLILEFLAPVWMFIMLMLVLVLSDTLTGVKAAKMRGDRITSKGLRRTSAKFIYYSLAIFLARGMEWVFLSDIQILAYHVDKINVTYGVAFFLASIELKSNYENISSILGIELWEAVKDYFKNRLK